MESNDAAVGEHRLARRDWLAIVRRAIVRLAIVRRTIVRLTIVRLTEDRLTTTLPHGRALKVHLLP
jgi:hypothetical protein